MTKILAMALAIIGIIMIINTGFNFVSAENAVDISLMDLEIEKNNSMQWSPIVGVVLLIGGMLVISTERNREIGFK